jgi:general secretion pathway protein F
VSASLPGQRRQFRAEAVRADGSRTSETFLAADERAALKLLAARGLTPVSLDDLGEVVPERVRGRIRAADRALAMRQLAGLIDGGVTLPDALSAVAANSPNARVASELSAVVAALAAGASLDEAFARAGTLLPDVAREVVSAGAAAGALPTVLNRLADDFEAANVLRGRLVGALVYPALVGAVALAVIAALFVFVLPQIVAAFGQSGQSLPWLTRVLIGLGNILRDHALPIGASLALLAIAAVFAWRRMSHLRREALLARLPWVGDLRARASAVRTLSALALLVRGAVPLPQATAVAARVAPTEDLRSRLLAARDALVRGQAVTAAFRDADAFDPMTLELMQQGEAVGELARALDKAVELKRQALEQRVQWFAALVEPVMIVVLGAIVLTLVLAVMLPIVTLNSAVR